jgi:ERF superfamily
MSTTNNKTIHARLNQARKDFHAKTHDKTGKHVNYMYFELSDFLLDALKAFDDAGLCGIVSFGVEEARMKIVDVETKEVEVITTPMSTAALKGCHPVQNLGAVQTYLRRYLWSAAIELVEADKVDASVKEDETLPKDKFIARKFPAVAEKKAGAKPAPAGRQTWEGHILGVKPVSQGTNSSGPWTLYAIEMDEDRSATTFKEDLANDARIIGSDVLVQAVVQERQNNKGEVVWSWVTFETLENSELPLK